MKIACKKCGSSVLTFVRKIVETTRYPISSEGKIRMGSDQYNGDETEFVECDNCQTIHDVIREEKNEELIIEIKVKE